MTIAIFALAASVARADGTAVGHPVSTAAGTALAFTDGEIPVATLVFDRCDDTTDTLTVNATLDILGEGEIPFPEGETCGLRINPSGNMTLSGSGGGGTFELSLDLGPVDIVIDPPVVVADEESSHEGVRIADSGWISVTFLDLDPEEHVSVTPLASSLHGILCNAVRQGSTVY